MTEASYEQLRDTTDGEAGIAWRDADRWSSYLREKFEALEADEKLSGEGKYEAAEEYLKKTRPRIESAYEAARKHLEAEAKRARDAAVPLPDGRDLSTTKIKDSNEMLAVQGEAQAIVARVERLKASRPKGMQVQGDHTTAILRDAYASSMAEAGVEGRIKAYGVLKACEQLGVDRDEVVQPLRGQKHFDAAEESWRLENLRRSVPSGKNVPANPFAAQKQPQGGDFHTRRGATLFKNDPGLQPASGRRIGGSERRRKPLWK